MTELIGSTGYTMSREQGFAKVSLNPDFAEPMTRGVCLPRTNF